MGPQSADIPLPVPAEVVAAAGVAQEPNGQPDPVQAESGQGPSGESADASGSPVPVLGPEADVVVNPDRGERVRVIASVVLGSKIRETENKRAGLQQTDPSAASEMDLDLGVNVVRTLGVLQDLQEGEPWEFAEDSPLPIAREGEENPINVEKLTRSGGKFVCTVKGQDDTFELDRQAVLDAYLTSGADVILATFPQGDPRRKALELHIKVLRGEEGALADTAAVDKTIVDAEESLQLDELAISDREWQDQLFSAESIKLVSEIVAARERGETQNVYYLTLISRMVDSAKVAVGEGGDVLRFQALKALVQTRRINTEDTDVRGQLERVGKRAEAMQERVLRQLGLSDEEISSIEAHPESDEIVAKRVQQGIIQKAKGVRELVFGEDMTDEAIESLFNLPKDKKSVAWYIIIALILGKTVFEPFIKDMKT